MNPTSVLCLGGEVPSTYNRIPSLLIRFPGESTPSTGTGVTISPATLDECLLHLRSYYAHHQHIAALGGLQILADHPIEGSADAAPPMSHSDSPAALRAEWAPKIEAKLCELLDDLGNCPMDSWKGARHVILNGEQIAESPSSRELMYAHAGEPAIVLGSGPSASDFLSQIHRIRAGVRIFCADTMLRGLLAHGIVPDYVCAIERESNITKVLSADAGCGATLIASPFIEPECVKKWGKNLLFWWGADDIFRWMDPKIEAMSSGRSSGSLALAAAAQAGCSKIYLVGHDLAFRNGHSHADSAHSVAHSAHKAAFSDPSELNPLRQRCLVEANHTGMIETCGLWNRIRGDLEGIIANHPNWQVVNVCNHGGARIIGAPVGTLPEMPMSLPPIQRLKPSGVQSPLRRVTSINLSLLEMGERLEAAAVMLDNGTPLDFIAESVQISRLAGVNNASLIHYVSRSVFSSMTMRMHMEAARGVPREVSQRNALRVTITTLMAIVERMKQEMPL